MIRIIRLNNERWQNAFNKAIPIIKKDAVQIGIITFPPKTRSPANGFSIHKENEEFAYILSGELLFCTDKNCYKVREGDLLYNSKGTPHYILNEGDKPVKVLWVLSPPIEF